MLFTHENAVCYAQHYYGEYGPTYENYLEHSLVTNSFLDFSYCLNLTLISKNFCAIICEPCVGW